MFKDVFSQIFEGCFQAEIENKLGYSKYDYQNKNTNNSRNGYSKKKLKSDCTTKGGGDIVFLFGYKGVLTYLKFLI